jgi:hypothetical protein
MVLPDIFIMLSIFYLIYSLNFLLISLFCNRAIAFCGTCNIVANPKSLACVAFKYVSLLSNECIVVLSNPSASE